MKFHLNFPRTLFLRLPFLKLLWGTIILVQLLSCSQSNRDRQADIPVPLAKIHPQTLSIHGDQRIDNYYWIRDDSRSDPEVLALLDAENQYTQAMLTHTEQLQTRLFDEITARLKADEKSVPVKSKDYIYYREFRQGGEQPLYLRRKADIEAEEQVLLDVNEHAEGHSYYKVGNWNVSHGQDLLAYAEDTVGRREYTLRFKHIDSGSLLKDRIQGVSSSIAWARDNETVFYVKRHPLTLLPYQVYRHRLGENPAKDKLVYEENDPAFHVSVYTSRSDDYVVISLDSTSSTEIRLINAQEPLSAAVILLPREANHEYRIRHVPGHFYILTNWEAVNFRVMRVTEQKIGSKDHWQEVLAHREGTLLEDMELFEEYLVVNERSMGLSHLKIMSLDGELLNNIEFPESVYTLSLHSNPEVQSPELRYVYDSLTLPKSVYEYNFNSQTTTLLQRQEPAGNYDPEKYRSERVWISARDGAKVPVSMVYRKDLFEKGKNPLYLNAYGAYGYSLDPYFRSKRLSLIDRGFVFALVHVRGGSELGRHWYQEGKLFNKKNTFQDFIDATRKLTDQGWGDEDKVFAMGGSAGGLLMGVIANEAPELYKAVIAHVPFVDVVTTMLDDSIPLTTEEFEEWGNPGVKKDYRYMLSYSPYDRVSAKKYPYMLVTTGLHDSQVQYFEPVKWVSKLRHYNSGENPILLQVNMDTGHGGASGRYERYRMDAREYAFILDAMDIDK